MTRERVRAATCRRSDGNGRVSRAGHGRMGLQVNPMVRQDVRSCSGFKQASRPVPLAPRRDAVSGACGSHLSMALFLEEYQA